MGFNSNFFPSKSDDMTAAEVFAASQELRPTTGEVISAYTEDVFLGQGSLSQFLTSQDVIAAKDVGTPLSEEEFKQKKYNPNIKFEADMTEKSADILNNYFNEQEERDLIIQSARTYQDILGFGISTAASFVEPKQFATGVVLGGVVGGSAAAITARTGQRLLSRNISKRALQVGAATGLAEAVTAVPLDVNTAKNLQQDYDILDGFIDTAVGMALGAGADIAINKLGTAFKKAKDQKNNFIKNKKDRQNNPIEFSILDNAPKYNLNPDHIYALVAYESGLNPKAVNPDSGAFGLGQMMPSVAKHYGITDKSSVQDQVDALLKYTNDNQKIFKNKMGRDFADPNEMYMAHWLGASGAAEVLSADPNVKFADYMKKNTPYYKRKDGISYASQVLKQNRLPADATMRDVIEASKERIYKYMGESQFIEPSPELIARTDQIQNQALQGVPQSTDSLVTKEISEVYRDAEKFINDYNKDYLIKKDQIDKKIQDLVTTGKIDKIDEDDIIVSLDQYRSGIETRLQQYKQKVEQYQVDFQIPDAYKPSFLEVESSFYKQEVANLKNIGADLKKIQDFIGSFNIEDRVDDLLKQKQYPTNVIKGMEEELADFEQRRELEKENIKGNKRRKIFEEETQARKEQLKNDLQFIKSEQSYKVKQANQQAKLEIVSLEKRRKKLENQALKLSQDIINHSNDVQSRMDNFYRDSVLKEIDPLNNPIYDRAAIDDLNVLHDELNAKPEKSIEADSLKNLENTIKDYIDKNLLDEDELKIFDDLYKLDDNDYKEIQKQAEVCLLTGGKA